MVDQTPSPGAAATGSHAAAGGSKRRACAKCARLKMKCLWPPEDKIKDPEACIRCARMGLTCSVPAAIPRKKRAPSSRVAQLESRIDGIISLLSTNQQQSQPGNPTAPSPLTPDSSTAVANKTEGAAGRAAARPRNPQHVPRPVRRSDAVLELLPNFRLTAQQAVHYLATYRSTMMPKYPFVIIPDHVDAVALHHKSKCLFWTIMATISPLTSEMQADFKHWFRRHVAEEIVVQQHKSLELLQAILIHLAWGDFSFYVDMPTTTILQLANSLVVDLKLDREPGDPWLGSQSLLADAWKALEMRIPHEPSHTSHEMRAVLGYFHVSSPAASLFRRGPRLPWSRYLDRCCEALEKAREYETDLHIVALARLHRTADHIHTIFKPDGAADLPKYLRAPVFMAIERIQAELKSIIDAYPASEQVPSIMCHYHILIMRLYEPLINMSPTPMDDSSFSTCEPFQRSEGLWRCLQAASDYFNSQLSIWNPELRLQPFTFIGLAAFAIVTVSRLLLLDDAPDWNTAVARRRLDFAGVLATMGDQIEEADREARASGHSQRFLEDGNGSASRYCFKVRWIRQWYLAKLPAEERAAMAVSIDTAPEDITAATGQFDDMPLYGPLWDGFLLSMDPSFLSIPMAMPPGQGTNGNM
ncbi:hypothetical protein NLU13_5915 [Sarocladium strictum]|uniref:Zn(2)-C6 fungal-type domain-containing protein n=1 Tax=Sarocladium strictum TaxID=5046 RepID=A0AA39GEX4_SARSR|nr:hypothetical protein NLU13_5915 [Sarocladium strictum]